jgi:hypothetical protein
MHRLLRRSRCCCSTAGFISHLLCERVLLSLRSVSCCTFHSTISRLLSLSWECAISSSASFSRHRALALIAADRASCSLISAISCMRSTIDMTCLLMSYELWWLVLEYLECWSLSVTLCLLLVSCGGRAVDRLLWGQSSSRLGSLHEIRGVVWCGLATTLSLDGVQVRPLPFF